MRRRLIIIQSLCNNEALRSFNTHTHIHIYTQLNYNYSLLHSIACIIIMDRYSTSSTCVVCSVMDAWCCRGQRSLLALVVDGVVGVFGDMMLLLLLCPLMSDVWMFVILEHCCCFGCDWWLSFRTVLSLRGEWRGGLMNHVM
jgi:hypothetical protein